MVKKQETSLHQNKRNLKNMIIGAGKFPKKKEEREKEDLVFQNDH